ncbi:hypothetical protein AMS68_002490 [Peltaster fructicola]|uniref:NmrA-like domain-containing protein n=1 Tax=Peltaster fructicola TaxID=286661 RepID=A0A6H0XQJ0_9PEZI|nr:hypothetical protein AMS68_002490 [Peltaster fructicola]
MSVIVFGPTGNVGSFAARTAHQHGAKVVLAMRDTSKSIPGLAMDDEKRGGFERVTADLTKPDTVAAAVKQSGAKRAFIYLAHQAQDHMKATIEALKTSGIELVVFLSSYTVTRFGSLDVPKEEIIPWLHAEVEKNLETTFGSKGYVALRPGAFATNAAGWWRQMIRAGEVQMFAPQLKFDWTAAEDMGGVAGVILAQGPKNGEKIVHIFGPNYISQQQAFEIVQKEALNKPVKLTIIDNPELNTKNMQSLAPGPIAKYLTDKMVARSKESDELEFPNLKEGQDNVQKYTGRPAVTFEQYVKGNKADFE